MGAWTRSRSLYRGAPALELEADGLRAVILPDWGGKIASLRAAVGGGEGVELLYQPTSPRIVQPRPGARFSKDFSWGWDDLFPTVSPCAYGLHPYEDLRLGDHGEIWSAPAAVSQRGEGCTMSVRGQALPFRLEKTLTPVPGGLRIEWKLENRSDDDLTYLWSAHPLFAVEGDSFVVGPRGDIHVGYESPRGASAEVSLRDGLTRMPEHEPCAIKYFFHAPLTPQTLPLELHRPSVELVLRMNVDTRFLPFLGIWLNARGWEDQYTLALEPTTGLGDSLEDARANGTARVLAPRSMETWWIELSVAATP